MGYNVDSDVTLVFIWFCLFVCCCCRLPFILENAISLIIYPISILLVGSFYGKFDIVFGLEPSFYSHSFLNLPALFPKELIALPRILAAESTVLGWSSVVQAMCLCVAAFRMTSFVSCGCLANVCFDLVTSVCGLAVRFFEMCLHQCCPCSLNFFSIVVELRKPNGIVHCVQRAWAW